MNKFMKLAFTAVGKIYVKKIIKDTAEKLSQQSGLQKEEIEEELRVGFKVKGNSNIFFDLKSLQNLAVKKNERLNINDIFIIVFRDNDPRIDDRHFAKIDKDKIKGVFRIKPEMINFRNNSSSPRPYEENKIESQEMKNLPNKNNERVINLYNKKAEKIEGTDESKVNLDNVFNKPEEEENKSPTISLTDIENIQLEDESEIEELFKNKETGISGKTSSVVNKTTETTKKAVNAVVSEISEFKDIIDTLKRKGNKLNIIVEVCDTSRSFVSDGQSLETVNQAMKRNGYHIPYGRNNSLHGLNHMQYSSGYGGYQYNGGTPPMYSNSNIMEFIHVYKNKKYWKTISRVEFLDLLKETITEGDIVIDDIKTVQTIRDEFTPKKKWV